MLAKFQFDKKTGTYVPSENGVKQAMDSKIKQDISQTNKPEEVKKPEFKETKKIETKAETSKAIHQFVKMKRVDKPTAIQLIDESGKPEAYLDSTNVGITMFRELQDYDICQITDENTGKVLGFIGGYALQINFNMAELRTMEKIEACLNGLTKLFRHKIMTQTLDK